MLDEVFFSSRRGVEIGAPPPFLAATLEVLEDFARARDEAEEDEARDDEVRLAAEGPS